MTTKKAKPRLGRGLSGLIAQPVQVEPKQKTSISSDKRSNAPANGKPGSASGSSALVMVELSSLKPNPFQPRSEFDEPSLEALSASIKKSGLLQPIAVRVAAGVGWEVIAGERRWRAAERAGLASIPALVCEATDREAAEYALVENLQREDLNPIERAEAFRALIDKFGLSQAEVAQGAGVARASVANLLRVLDLEAEIQDLIKRSSLTLGHAKALLAGPAGPSRVEAAHRMAKEGWSVRQSENWAKTTPLGPSKSEQAPAVRDATSTKHREIERQLGEHLGTKVLVKTKGDGRRGTLQVQFYSLEQFDGLMERMGFSMTS